MKYAILIEKSRNTYGAYPPDLPGCVAVGKTIREVKKLMAEALALHLEDMRKTKQAIPAPSTICEYFYV